MNRDILKCKRCRQTFIEEEFDKHPCTPHLTGVREIEFDYYYMTKDKMNRETIVIKGMDGILYGFVKRESKPSDKAPFLPLSNDGYHKHNSDDKLTEPVIYYINI